MPKTPLIIELFEPQLEPDTGFILGWTFLLSKPAESFLTAVIFLRLELARNQRLGRIRSTFDKRVIYETTREDLFPRPTALLPAHDRSIMSKPQHTTYQPGPNGSSAI